LALRASTHAIAGLFRQSLRRLGLLSLVVVGDCLLAAPPTAAQPSAPTVVVERFKVYEIDWAGQRRLWILGMVENQGPQPAARVQVDLKARRTPGGEVLAHGAGQSWLPVLDPGESGPFSVAVFYCCEQDVGEFDFSVDAVAAPARRYRDLAIEGIVTRPFMGAPWLYGELANAGETYLTAPATKVFVGFWQGADLAALDTARMPIFFGVEGAGSQAHPPGLRYPWAVRLPDVPYDRYQVWAYAEPYPGDLYPVPLGAADVAAERVGDDVTVRASVRHCGREPVASLVTMVVARDAEGRVVEFGRAALDLSAPLVPGAHALIAVAWPAAPPDVDPARVSLTPLALAAQAVRPVDPLCRPPAGRAWLPWLERGLGWPGD